MFKKPHLCTDADLSLIDKPVICMIKYDGVRLLNPEGKPVGRSLKPFKNLRVNDAFADPMFYGFDIEACDGALNSQELCNTTTGTMNRILGSLPENLVLFDNLKPELIGLPYYKRLEYVEQQVKNQSFFAHDEFLSVHKKKEVLHESTLVNLIVPEYKLLRHPDDIQEYYQWVVSLGYEGLILRDPHGMYKNGRATKKEGAYLRMKPTEDSECRVLEMIEEMQNLNEAKVNELGRTERSSHKENKVGKNTLGAMIVEDIHSGFQFKIGTGRMKDEDKKYWWERPDEFKSKIHKYAYLGTGIVEVPRHGRWIGFRAEEDL